MNYTMLIITVVATLLSVAVTGWIFYMIAKRYFDHQQKTQMLKIKMDERAEALRTITPIRLQAYERMALFLERISPDSLILRCYQPGMDLHLLQGVLTKNIRDEWEHNLSQQVYLSPAIWGQIREAKDQMINIVNSSAITLTAETDPTRLAAAIFMQSANADAPTEKVLEALKQEINQYFS